MMKINGRQTRAEIVADLKNPLEDIENLFCVEELEKRKKAETNMLSDEYENIRSQIKFLKDCLLVDIFSLESREAQVSSMIGDMIRKDYLLSQRLKSFPAPKKRIGMLKSISQFRVYAVCPDLRTWANSEEIDPKAIDEEILKVQRMSEKELQKWGEELKNFGYMLGCILLEQNPQIVTAKHIMRIFVDQSRVNVIQNLDRILAEKIHSFIRQ